MCENYWLGSNQLVIIFNNGTHHVTEEFENWKTVFDGSYEACLEYCKIRQNKYIESIVG